MRMLQDHGKSGFARTCKTGVTATLVRMSLSDVESLRSRVLQWTLHVRR